MRVALVFFVLQNCEKLLRDELYVMIMLQRASEGEDKDLCEMCLATGIGADKCEAVCGNEDNGEEDNGKVKSGDLEVSVDTNKGADAFLYGGTSDLDTINFKASEEGVTVTKVTLERFGYSSSEDVDVVWLEDENGTRITDPKELNSKDQVTLSILKDYRELSENSTMTIVLQTYDGKLANGNADPNYKPGSSIGFKVIDIETSAANVDASDIKGNPYLYDLVTYNGSDVIFNYKGKANTYHIGEGPYEVFRFKLKASSTSAALVRGFDIENKSANTRLDLEDFVENVKVTVNDEEIKKVSYSIDDDKISISFDDVEIAAKENAIFAVSIELSDDFDELESAVLFKLDTASDLKVVEKKTGARVSIDNFANLNTTAEYTFNGSKLSLSNTKLGKVNMAAGSDDVAIAEGTIELGGQSLVIAGNTITVVATSDTQLVKKNNNVDGAGIEAMRLVVEGEEFDAKCTDTASMKTTCVFNKKITIEKEGKLQLVVDIDDDAAKDSNIEFTIAGKKLFGKTSIGTNANGYINGFTYEDSKKGVLASDFVGSITIYDLKVTAAKASIENKLNKAVDFKLNETTTDVPVFEGTYTAKKQDLTLTDVNYYPVTALKKADDSVTLKLYIDDKLVSSTDIDKNDAVDVAVNDQTTRVSIKAGETVNVKVLADVYPDATNVVSYKVELVGEDTDGNSAGIASDYTVDMKFVENGSLDVEAISNSNYKQKDVLLRASNLPIAAFRVSASNGTVDLDKMKLTIAKSANTWNAGSNGSKATATYTVVAADLATIMAASANWNFAYANGVVTATAKANGPFNFATTQINGKTFTQKTAGDTSTPAEGTYTVVAADLATIMASSADWDFAYANGVVTATAKANGAIASCTASTTKETINAKEFTVTACGADDVAASCSDSRYTTEAACIATAVKANDIKIKINGEDIDSDNISDGANADAGKILVTDISKDGIDKDGVEVVVSLKGTPAPSPYTITLNEVNGENKGIVFKKNIVPALVTIEQTDNHGSTTFKFTVDKYDVSNTVSNICVHFSEAENATDATTAKRCLNTDVSNGSTLEVKGGTNGSELIEKISYDVAGVANRIEIKKSDYNDFFKIGETYLKVFDKDSK